MSIQRLLKECCFSFCPEMVISKSWECPEAVELHKATAALLESWNEILHQALLPALSEQLTQILHDLNEIQHSAVHRLRLLRRQVGHVLSFTAEKAVLF